MIKFLDMTDWSPFYYQTIYLINYITNRTNKICYNVPINALVHLFTNKRTGTFISTLSLPANLADF